MLTFHKILEGCEAGRAEAWQAFAAEYSPVSMAILRTHLRSTDGARPAEAWRAALGWLRSPGFEALRGLDHQSEKELLLGLRRLALTKAASIVPAESEARSDASSGAASAAIRTSFEARPLAHQQILLLKLAGYDDARIGQLLRVAPSMVERASEGSPALRPPAADDWLRFLAETWASSTSDCAASRSLVRLQEGQMTWYDREPLERHMSGCARCLELWTALAEVRYWRRECPPLPEAEAARLLEGARLAGTAAP